MVGGIVAKGISAAKARATEGCYERTDCFDWLYYNYMCTEHSDRAGVTQQT